MGGREGPIVGLDIGRRFGGAVQRFVQRPCVGGRRRIAAPAHFDGLAVQGEIDVFETGLRQVAPDGLVQAGLQGAHAWGKQQRHAPCPDQPAERKNPPALHFFAPFVPSPKALSPGKRLTLCVAKCNAVRGLGERSYPGAFTMSHPLGV